MNLMDEITKIKEAGYSEINAEAKLCQDIMICAISKSSLRRNVTIKGGVVMRSLSGEKRRATQDIDIDFIRYSISEDAIKVFVEQLNCIDGVCLSISEPLEKLKHQDYNGKRVHIDVTDDEGYCISSKVDIGVHKDLDIEQEEYCFDVCIEENIASVLINSKEQMITEKLKSMLRFGVRSTRYKDIFDICYLSDFVEIKLLDACLEKYIFSDETLGVTNREEIKNRIVRMLRNKNYKINVDRSKKNWLNMSVDEAFDKVIRFIASI